MPSHPQPVVTAAPSLQSESVTAATHPVASADQVLLLHTELLGRDNFDEAATALAQQLATLLKCDRVSIGWRESSGMKVVALSNAVDIHAQQESMRLLAAAFEEAEEQGVSLIHPEPENVRPLILVAHDDLARRQGNSLCTIPLAYNQRIVGAMTIERREPAFAPAEIPQIERLATLLTPALALKYENGLSLWRRWVNSTRTAIEDRLNNRRPASRPMIAVGVGLVALSALWLLLPATYSVNAPARLEGAIQRVLTAPADGYLHKVHFRPGDHVKADQVLAELAEQDMLIEQRGLEAELVQRENALVAAQARSDRAEFIVSQGQADAVRAKLDLVRQHLGRSQLRAPFDGIVIKGDLSQSIGTPVERGSELMTMAPDTGYRVMIEADETDIADLKPGQRGRLILAALPAQTLPLKIERLTPLASSDEGRHFFPVYATLETEVPGLRPGLQGYARVDIDQRPRLLNWVAHAMNWARLKLWSWGM